MEYSDFIGLAGALIVAPIVQVCKGFVADERFYPVISICLGVLLNLGIAIGRQGDIMLAVLVGVATGLAASGLYSGQKTIRQ